MHWREKELLEILKEGRFTSTNLVNRANMSKVTALKYLEKLKEKGLIDCEIIGSAKIWFLKQKTETKTATKINVLVVDDDRNVITIIRDTLEHDLFEIHEAETGKEALGMVFDAIPDIIILDIMMPSMDGYTVCKKLKERDRTKNIPIIILSAKTSLNDKLKAMEMGIDDYVVKPFDPLELRARIKMALKLFLQ